MGKESTPNIAGTELARVQDVSALPRAQVSVDEKTGAVGVAVNLDGSSTPEDYKRAMCRAFGVSDYDLAKHLHSQLVRTLPGGLTEENYNESLTMVRGFAPEDQIEGLLAVQMVATHFAAMKCLKLAHSAEYLETMNSYFNQTNKLLRTFAAQTEALKKHRSKASQTVRVERVYVNEGGQAIVGDVHSTGGGATRKSEG